jgi:16S rRNA (cytosine1402-N4)-methyltransferase
MTMYHKSVLLDQSIKQMNIRPDGIYVDATFGGGGHAEQILNSLGDKGRLFGFDQDEDAKANSMNKPIFADSEQFVFVQSNFRHLKRSLRAEGVKTGKLDGILADLGVSSYQIDTPERGFSYRFDAPLDMRMNKKDAISAADLLNKSSAEKLQGILSDYGELRNAKTLALAIVQNRYRKPYKTTGDLVNICEANLIGERPRYLSQVFQALRMEVNDELGALKDFLNDSLEMLKPGGLMAIITFHSIEDRIVKNFFKTGDVEGKIDQDFYGKITRPFDVITKKPIEPDAEETKLNPRSRSARLRVAKKIQ